MYKRQVLFFCFVFQALNVCLQTEFNIVFSSVLISNALFEFVDVKPASGAQHLAFTLLFFSSSFYPLLLFSSASDIFASGPLSSSVDTYHVTGLKLREDTGYYSSVTAEGASGLVTWDVSDGVLLDTQAPQAGLVMDGSGESAN